MDAGLLKHNAETPCNSTCTSYIQKLLEALEAGNKIVCAMNSELDQERNAARTAADEAMSTIFRLQKEKAVLQMESRHFEEIVEARAFHDQEIINSLKDTILQQEAEKMALAEELSRYRYIISWSDLEIIEGLIKTFQSTNIAQDKTRMLPAEDLLCNEVIKALPTVGTAEGERGLVPTDIQNLDCSIDELSLDAVHSCRVKKPSKTSEMLSVLLDYDAENVSNDNLIAKSSTGIRIMESMQMFSLQLSTLQKQILCLVTELNHSGHLTMVGHDSFIGLPISNDLLFDVSSNLDIDPNHCLSCGTTLEHKPALVEAVTPKESPFSKKIEALTPLKDLFCVSDNKWDHLFRREIEETESIHNTILMEDLITRLRSMHLKMEEGITDCENRLLSLEASRSNMLRNLKMMKRNLGKPDSVLIFATDLLKEVMSFTSVGSCTLELYSKLIHFFKCNAHVANEGKTALFCVRPDEDEFHEPCREELETHEPDAAINESIVSRLSHLWSNSLSWVSDERERAETALSGWDH